MTAEVAAHPPRCFGVWIPVLLVWLVLLPFVLLFVPLVFLACLVLRIGAWKGTAAYLQFFNAMRGLRLEFERPGIGHSIHIV